MLHLWESITKNEKVSMKFLIFCLFLINPFNNVWAEFPTIDIHNVNGEYLDEKGSAYAEKAYYAISKVKISHQNIHLDFNKKEKNLVISDPSTTVELEFDFSFLNVFKAFEFTNLDVKSNAKVFTINSEELDIYIDKKKYDLDGFVVQTDVSEIPTQDDEDITIIDGLVLNGTLGINKIQFSNFEEIFFQDLKVENPENKKEINELESKGMSLNIPMIVRLLKLNIKEGLFSGRAKIDSYINLWLKIGGSIKTNKENTILDIHLTKAKLGIFSVRSTLLNMVRRSGLDGVKVNGNHIIVDLATVVLGKK